MPKGLAVFFNFLVGIFMADMGKEHFSGFHFDGSSQSFVKTEMGAVSPDPQAADDEYARPVYQMKAGVGDPIGIGDVEGRIPRGFPYFPAQDMEHTMLYWYGGKGKRTDSYWFAGNSRNDPGLASALLGMFENIGETFPEFFQGIIAPVNWYGPFVAEGPQIVQPVNMVRMGMGQEHRVQAPDARPNRLEPEFRPCINHHPLPGIPFDIEGCPHTGIMGVFRSAYPACTTHHRNTVGSARPKNSQFHKNQYTVLLPY